MSPSPLQTKTRLRQIARAQRQKGVAIITALLIVTLAATISITISTRLQLDVRRTSNLIATDQAYVYSLLAEESLEIVLQDEDLRKGFIDLLIKDGVARQPLVIDNASIEVEVTDLNACININSLVSNNGTINKTTQTRLQQLFANSQISRDLTPAIIDWIDTDLTDTPSGGAEDGYYLNLEKPYRTAQIPLYSISELRLIRGFEDNKTYSRVKRLIDGYYDKELERQANPALCAYVSNGPTPININTASVEVLESIQPDISEAQIAEVITNRTEEALTSIPAVFTTPDNLALESSYYLLKSKVTIGNANKVMYSIIFWDGQNSETVSRSQRTL